MSSDDRTPLPYRQILIFQTDRRNGLQLADYFHKRGARVWMTVDPVEACKLVTRHHPDLVFIDLHAPGKGWLELLGCVHHTQPAAGLVVTNRHPDVRRELLAKERGVTVFLREPFTPIWIETALRQLSTPGKPTPRRQQSRSVSARLPLVRVPMRFKITVPYALLALFFAVASIYLISRYVIDSLQDRYYAQLIDSGQITADWIVQEEERLLSTLRLVANTEGVAEAVTAGEAENLRRLILPLTVNAQEDAVDILDLSGSSVLSLHHPSDAGVEVYTADRGDNTYRDWSFVQAILTMQHDDVGDKFAGIGERDAVEYLYVAGPIYDSNGNRVGVVLIGKTLSRLVGEIRRDTMAHVTFYTPQGRLLASTHLLPEAITAIEPELLSQVFQQQDTHSSLRELQIGSVQYSELLAPLEVRSGDDIGVLGVALAHNFFVRPSTMTQVQAIVVIFLAFIAVVGLGLLLSHQITQPLSDVVNASIQVAQGNLGIKVPSKGNDEVMVLAHAFNYMVSGLQEGSIYRDLLGRTVSPEVRQALRDSFASGNLRLEGQNAVATVLMSDIRNFTTLSELVDPPTVLNWLNEYFSEMVPVITAHGGVVDKFEGDSMLAFFGILPRPLLAEESAHQACLAAVELLSVIDGINQRRAGRGEPALITGIGINTGTLTAGGLGTTDRLNYTIIGDTVNTTQRLQATTRDFGVSAVVISEFTLAALGGRRNDFELIPLGEKAFRGKQELIWLYRLMPGKDRQAHGSSA